MEDHATLDRFTIIRSLGEGGFSKVKLVKDADGNQFAAKILLNLGAQMMERISDSLRSEVGNLKLLEHPNILTLIEYKENAVYTKKNGDQVLVTYLLLEVCSQGTLFDKIYYSGTFLEENIARYYFRQILSALEACHHRGICHRDIKPENILFDSKGNLKLSDFGFSISIEGRNGTGYLGSNVGTIGYKAPEITQNKFYEGEAADIFSLGVVLFIMRSYNPPFKNANLNDPHYSLLVNNETRFWDICGKNKQPTHFSNSFKRLIKGMLMHDSNQRFTIADIKNSQWYNENTEFQMKISEMTIDDVANLSRNDIDNEIIVADRVRFSGRMYRGSLFSRTTSIMNEDYIIMPITVEEIAVLKYSYIFTTLEPNRILTAITMTLDSLEASYTPISTNLLIKVTCNDLEFKICFFRYKEMILVYLRKKVGNEYDLYDKFKEINLAIKIMQEETEKLG